MNQLQEEPSLQDTPTQENHSLQDMPIQEDADIPTQEEPSLQDMPTQVEPDTLTQEEPSLSFETCLLRSTQVEPDMPDGNRGNSEICQKL